MNRNLLTMAVVAVALFAARLPAEAANAAKPVAPDWHYRWHEGRWWYWMPEDTKWMVWTGSTWIPAEKLASQSKVENAGQAMLRSVSVASEAVDESVTSDSANTSSNNCPTNYSGGSNYSGSGYSNGSGRGYAGYGWTWGPGTAYSNGPGPRF
jgi:hypothetical protein